MLLAEYKLTCLLGLWTAVENHSCSHLKRFMLFQIEIFLFSVHTCACYSPLVKTAVYDGVVHRRTHGKEKDCEINLLNVLLLVDVFLEAPQDEVYVIGQPADSKNDHNYHHGLHKLGKKTQCVIPGPLGDRLSLLGEWEMLLLFCPPEVLCMVCRPGLLWQRN